MASTGSGEVSRRQVLERYKHVRDDHLRYMQKWGIVRPMNRAPGEPFYTFADLAVIREADLQLAEGVSFRAVLRHLVATRFGQLAFDFRLEAQPAKVLNLRRRELPPLSALLALEPRPGPSSAEQCFAAASSLDDGNPDTVDRAAAGYRRALSLWFGLRIAGFTRAATARP